jgi:amino acid permease
MSVMHGNATNSIAMICIDLQLMMYKFRTHILIFINYIFLVLCPYIYHIFLSHKAKEKTKKHKKQSKKKKQRNTKTKQKEKNKEKQKAKQKEKTLSYYPWRTTH